MAKQGTEKAETETKGHQNSKPTNWGSVVTGIPDEYIGYRLTFKYACNVIEHLGDIPC